MSQLTCCLEAYKHCMALIVNQMNYKTTSEQTILEKQVLYLQNGGKATFSPGYATPKNVILQKGLPILRKSGDNQ